MIIISRREERNLQGDLENCKESWNYTDDEEAWWEWGSASLIRSTKHLKKMQVARTNTRNGWSHKGKSRIDENYIAELEISKINMLSFDFLRFRDSVPFEFSIFVHLFRVRPTKTHVNDFPYDSDPKLRSICRAFDNKMWAIHTTLPISRLNNTKLSEGNPIRFTDENCANSIWLLISPPLLYFYWRIYAVAYIDGNEARRYVCSSCHVAAYK